MFQTSLPVRVRIPAIPKRPWLRGRGPSPRARWFQWKICRGSLDEQNIPRGGARAVQPGMPFPNLYLCNKVLVNQKNKYHPKHIPKLEPPFAEEEDPRLMATPKSQLLVILWSTFHPFLQQCTFWRAMPAECNIIAKFKLFRSKLLIYKLLW